MAQSKADFVSKVSIVVEEADECCFWMEFIIGEGVIDEARVMPLLEEAKELTAIFVTSRKTAKDRSCEFAANA
jgi:four helix bundle protein